MRRRYNNMCNDEKRREQLQEQYRRAAIKAARESARRISEINQEALAQGLTYGQYVAKLYMKSQKEAVVKND